MVNGPKVDMSTDKMYDFYCVTLFNDELMHAEGRTMLSRLNNVEPRLFRIIDELESPYYD